MLSTLSVAQIQILCHGAALGFLVLGQVVSRYQQPLIRRDLLVNVGTGLGILIVIKPLMVWANSVLSLHLVSLESLPVVLQFLLAFIALDFTRYWLHYMHHRVPFFGSFTGYIIRVLRWMPPVVCGCIYSTSFSWLCCQHCYSRPFLISALGLSGCCHRSFS